MLLGIPRLVRIRGARVDHLGEEPFEDLVHRGATIPHGDVDHLLGILEIVQAEDVGEEGEPALGPSLRRNTEMGRSRWTEWADLRGCRPLHGGGTPCLLQLEAALDALDDVGAEQVVALQGGAQRTTWSRSASDTGSRRRGRPGRGTAQPRPRTAWLAKSLA